MFGWLREGHRAVTTWWRRWLAVSAREDGARAYYFRTGRKLRRPAGDPDSVYYEEDPWWIS